MALIVVQSFPNQQTLERSYPTKCPESDQPQLGHPLRSRGDTSLQTLPKVGTSLEKRDATLLLVQDLIPSFKSICLGLSLRGGVHYRHYSGGQPRPGCDGVYASYLSVTDRLSVKRPNSLGCPHRQLLCIHRSIGCKLESNYTEA